MEDRIINNPLRFPGIGFGVSAKLRHLLSRMLDKDPRFRMTIDDVCNHEWLRRYEPMPGLSEQEKRKIEPTRADQNNAIFKENVFTAFKRHLRNMRSTIHILGSSINSKTRRLRKKELSKPGRQPSQEDQEEIFE